MIVIVYQQIENYVLQPTIIGRAARVSGFTVIVSVLVFGSLFGVIGAIIGVPTAAALQIGEELTANCSSIAPRTRQASGVDPTTRAGEARRTQDWFERRRMSGDLRA